LSGDEGALHQLVALGEGEPFAAAVRALALREDWSGVALYADLFGRPRFMMDSMDGEGGT